APELVPEVPTQHVADESRGRIESVARVAPGVEITDATACPRIGSYFAERTGRGYRLAFRIRPAFTSRSWRYRSARRAAGSSSDGRCSSYLEKAERSSAYRRGRVSRGG